MTLAAIIWTSRTGVISPKDFGPVRARTGSTKIIDSVHRHQAKWRRIAPLTTAVPPPSTTVPSGSKTTKYISRIGPLIVSEKQINQNGTGVVRNSCVSSATTCHEVGGNLSRFLFRNGVWRIPAKG
jgi:hypothetical protein